MGEMDKADVLILSEMAYAQGVSDCVDALKMAYPESLALLTDDLKLKLTHALTKTFIDSVKLEFNKRQ